MNSLIQELHTELKSNQAINEHIMVKMVVEAINNSAQLGVEPDQILENALSNLGQVADMTTNENLKEVVAKFKKLEKSRPTAFRQWQKRLESL